MDIWTQIKAGLSVHAPSLIPNLNPGASEDEIRHLEVQLGLKLPKDIRESYQIHNGACNEYCLIRGWPEFYSLEDISREWELWKDLLDSDHFISDQSVPKGPIKTDWWNPKWIPVFGNRGGDHICLDLDPPSDGQMGQLITMWHEIGAEEVLASSFRDYLVGFAADLNAGAYIFLEEYGGLIPTSEHKERVTRDQQYKRQFAKYKGRVQNDPQVLLTDLRSVLTSQYPDGEIPEHFQFLLKSLTEQLMDEDISDPQS